MSLTICKKDCDNCIHWDYLHHVCFNQKGCDYQEYKEPIMDEYYHDHDEFYNVGSEHD